VARTLIGLTMVLAVIGGLLPAFARGPTVDAVKIGNEGCTPGYWKTHTEDWEEYTSSQTLAAFNLTFPASLADFEDLTILEALQGGGGPGLDGAVEILLRATAAAYLNAASEDVGYPYRRFDGPGSLQSLVNSALASLDRETILDLAAELDEANNLGCPLS